MDLTFNDTFDLKNYGGKHKLFDGGSMKLDYSLTIPVDAKTPEGQEIEKMAKADWVKQMKAFKDAKEKEYREIIAVTEANVMKTAEKKKAEFMKVGGMDKAMKALKEWLDREIEGVNVMIKQALKAFEGVVQKAMNDLWTKVATAIDKKFKSDIKKQKIKAVFKIIGWAGIIVLAAAASIVAGVIGLVTAPTGVGTLAAVGVILASVATGVTAVKKIYDTYAANWPDHKKSAKLLIEKTQALKEALEYEEKKLLKTSQGDKLGPKERMKLFLGNAAGKRKELESAIKDIATWTGSILQDVEKDAKASEAFEKQIEEVEAKLKTEKDDKKAAELRKLVDEYVKHMFQKRVKMENARLYLKRYAALVIEGQNIMKDESKLTPSVLGGFLAKLQTMASSDEVGHLITAGKSGAELFKAILKATSK